MTDQAERSETRWNCTYIHNVFANFYKDSLDYFSTYLYPRFKYTVISTYSKAVEYLEKKEQYNREIDKPILPALILNPSGDFGLADANAGGRQLWRFPNLAVGMIKRISPPIYQDEQVMVTPGYLRLKGEIELIMLLGSFYEYCDVKLLMLQIFGGFERWIHPRFFTTFIILPEELINYRYTNEYTGMSYVLNWDSAGSKDQLVKTTSLNELVIPCSILPKYKLMSLSDASTRYGGTDKLADWRLTAMIEYEIEIPHFLLLESDYLAKGLNLEVRSGSCFSEYSDYQQPVNRTLIDYHWDWSLDSTSSNVITAPDATSYDPIYIGDFVFKTRYFHEITESETKSIIDVDITLPEQITDERLLLVNSKNGSLSYGDHYIIVDDGWTLRIKIAYVTLEVGMFIELYIYEEIS